MPDILTVNAVPYRILRLLGKGKGGYSWLAERDGAEYVVKQLHHEPCDYYQFGDKLAAERGDYDRLVAAGIPVPKLLDVDAPNERILKAYIPGPTIFELVLGGGMRPIPSGDALWYVDYECNAFMEAWSYETWGIRYWSRTPEFLAHLAKLEASSQSLSNPCLP